jgi:hypothetical protein
MMICKALVVLQNNNDDDDNDTDDYNDNDKDNGNDDKCKDDDSDNTAAGGRTPGNDIITPSHCTKLQSDGYNRQSGA